MVAQHVHERRHPSIGLVRVDAGGGVGVGRRAPVFTTHGHARIVLHQADRGRWRRRRATTAPARARRYRA